jgi:hypothetical protein
MIASLAAFSSHAELLPWPLTISMRLKPWCARLRGYFDKVYAYSVEEDRFTESTDLRTLRGLRDAVLDATMPIIRSKWGTALNRWLFKRKNLCSHCYSCLSGRACPWDRCLSQPCILYRGIWGDPDDHWKWPS